MQTTEPNDELRDSVDHYLAERIQLLVAKRRRRAAKQQKRDAERGVFAHRFALRVSWRADTVWHDGESGRDFANLDELLAALDARAAEAVEALIEEAAQLITTPGGNDDD